MLEANYEMIILLLTWLDGGACIGYIIRDFMQIRKEQEELEKHYASYVVDHLNCRCSLEYPEEDDEDDLEG